MAYTPLISIYIKSLGYCCEHRFFKLYKQTGLIAARLGVSSRAVRYRKALFKQGLLRPCEKCQRRLTGESTPQARALP